MIYFQPRGQLRGWMHGLATTLIMSYIEMQDEYGNKNLVVCRMEEIFQSKNGLTMEKLKSWSQLIAADFSAKNTTPKLLNLTSCSAHIIDAMNCNTTMLVKMTTTNNSKDVEINRQDRKIMVLESINNQQQIKIKQLEKIIT